MRASTKLVGAVAAAAVVAISTMVAIPAHAAPATGCSGQAVSFDGKGLAIDKATAPGGGGTSSDPLHVDVNGKIDWAGSTTGVIRNGSYTVKVSGFSVASGKFKNSDGKQASKGTEDVGKRLTDIPVLGWLTKTLKPTAVLKADYTITGQGQTCTGSVVLKIGDSPTFTPLWLTSVALFLIAFWLLFWPSGWLGGRVSR